MANRQPDEVTTRRNATAFYRTIVGDYPMTRGWYGWQAHEANGWKFDIIGGFRDNDPVWIRVSRDGSRHLPAGQTLDESTRVFADWLAKHGFNIKRESMTDPQLFRLVPGIVKCVVEPCTTHTDPEAPLPARSKHR